MYVVHRAKSNNAVGKISNKQTRKQTNAIGFVCALDETIFTVNSICEREFLFALLLFSECHPAEILTKAKCNGFIVRKIALPPPPMYQTVRRRAKSKAPKAAADAPIPLSPSSYLYYFIYLCYVFTKPLRVYEHTFAFIDNLFELLSGFVVCQAFSHFSAFWCDGNARHTQRNCA